MLPSKLQGGLMSENRMKISTGWHRMRNCHSTRLCQPPVEPLDSEMYIDFRSPSGGRFEFPGVGNVIALVTGPPLRHLNLRLAAMQRPDQLQQFNEADRIPEPSADVERLA